MKSQIKKSDLNNRVTGQSGKYLPKDPIPGKRGPKPLDLENDIIPNGITDRAETVGMLLGCELIVCVTTSLKGGKTIRTTQTKYVPGGTFGALQGMNLDANLHLTAGRQFTRRQELADKAKSAIERLQVLSNFGLWATGNFATVKSKDLTAVINKNFLDAMKTLYGQYEYLIRNEIDLKRMELGDMWEMAKQIIKQRVINLYSNDATIRSKTVPDIIRSSKFPIPLWVWNKITQGDIEKGQDILDFFFPRNSSKGLQLSIGEIAANCHTALPIRVMEPSAIIVAVAKKIFSEECVNDMAKRVIPNVQQLDKISYIERVSRYKFTMIPGHTDYAKIENTKAIVGTGNDPGTQELAILNLCLINARILSPMNTLGTYEVYLEAALGDQTWKLVKAAHGESKDHIRGSLNQVQRSMSLANPEEFKKLPFMCQHLMANARILMGFFSIVPDTWKSVTDVKIIDAVRPDGQEAILKVDAKVQELQDADPIETKALNEELVKQKMVYEEKLKKKWLTLYQGQTSGIPTFHLQPDLQKLIGDAGMTTAAQDVAKKFCSRTKDDKFRLFLARQLINDYQQLGPVLRETLFGHRAGKLMADEVSQILTGNVPEEDNLLNDL